MCCESNDAYRSKAGLNLVLVMLFSGSLMWINTITTYSSRVCVRLCSCVAVHFCCMPGRAEECAARGDDARSKAGP